MEEKIREEFNKPWDRDEEFEERERLEKRDKCVEIIKELVEEIPQTQEELLNLILEIKSVVNYED